MFFFFFSSRRRHTRCSRDWSSDVCSSDLVPERRGGTAPGQCGRDRKWTEGSPCGRRGGQDRKSTRLNSSHGYISYAVFCLKKKKHADNVLAVAEGVSRRHSGTADAERGRT